MNLGLCYTLFEDRFARSAEMFIDSWHGVIDKLRRANSYPTKGDCPLIKLAQFGGFKTTGGALRSDENLSVIYGVEADYDAGEVAPAEAVRRLEAAGIEAAIYTTPSHTIDRPRWRVLAPLAEAFAYHEGDNKAHRRTLVAILNEALGGILAPESFVASQAFYVGRVDGVEYEVQHSSGSPVDDLKWLYEGVFPAGISGEGTQAEREQSARVLAARARVDDETIH